MWRRATLRSFFGDRARAIGHQSSPVRRFRADRRRAPVPQKSGCAGVRRSCCFGIGPLLAERLGREHVEIIPSVSSVQLLFARLGEPWQHVRILSAHGRPIEPVIGPALSARYSAILTDDQHSPARIAGALLDAGMEDCRAVVGERLGGPAERIIDGTLASIVNQACDPLSVLALFRGQADVRVPRIGLAEHLYQHRDGMITKSEIRAVSLGQLAIQPGDIVWDIGAGCGSVGLEAASLVDSGFVYAIERDAQQVELIHHNLKTFPSPLRIISGEAPEVLADLPSPHAVFIGGSGGNLEKIVDVALKRLETRRPARCQFRDPGAYAGVSAPGSVGRLELRCVAGGGKPGRCTWQAGGAEPDIRPESGANIGRQPMSRLVKPDYGSAP